MNGKNVIAFPAIEKIIEIGENGNNLLEITRILKNIEDLLLFMNNSSLDNDIKIKIAQNLTNIVETCVERLCLNYKL